MQEKLQKICQDIPADYAEVRVHEASTTNVHYSGEELEDIGQRTGLGGCIRVLKDGGWGFVSFNDIDRIETFARRAVKQAEVAGGGPAELAAAQPQHASHFSRPEIDPAEIPLTDKQLLCEGYNERLLNDDQIGRAHV